MNKMRTAAAVVLAALALSACAQAGTNPSASEPGAPSMTSPTQPGASGPAVPPTDPTGSVAPRTQSGRPTPGPVTVTGTVTAGVEPGCLMLNDYQLIGGPTDLLKVGARVAVSGRAEPDMVTTCMQGIPLVVGSAKRA